MSRLFKKISAIILTAIMVLTMCSAVFANDAAMVENHAIIKDITAEQGITVTAYKIIDYDENGKYVPVLLGSISTNTEGSVETITAAEINNLATKTAELTNRQTLTRNEDGNYYLSVQNGEAPGTWMIIVSGSQYVYNPAIVSSKMDTDGKVKYGTLDYATDSWTDVNNEVYMKKSEPEIEKTAETVVEGNDIKGTQYGDIIKFTIKSDIPSYATGKTNIEYEINDTLDGLSLVTGTDYTQSAKVGTTDSMAADDTLTAKVTGAVVSDATSFTVKDLGDDWIQAHKGQQIEIVYYAKVTSNAKLSVDKNTNTATLKYSTYDGTKDKSSETKHYTFGIDTTVTGHTGTETANKTGEFIKINDKGDVEYTETTNEVKKTETDTEYLSGAEFQLRIGSAKGNLFVDAESKSTFTTDNDGKLEINGLDSDVTYYLVETKAPTGYSVNSTPVKVKISATFAEGTDTLTSYTVTIGDGTNAKITHYTYTDNTSDGVVTLVNTTENPSNPYGFKNTKLKELPSTGGMGTYIFTIVGVVLMVCAAGAFMVSRKKSED